MSTGLMTLPTNSLASQEDNAIFNELAGGSNFLPRLQFFVSSSTDVKEERIVQNHYGLVISKEEIIDLGKEFDCVPIARRWKALDLRVAGSVLNYFKRDTPQFDDVFKTSKVKDSKCMAGVEFLIWVPSEEKFCTFFCFNISSKAEAGKIDALINHTATLKSKYIKRPENSYHCIVCIESSTPPSALPDADLLAKEFDAFVNAKDSVSAAASAEEVAATSGRVQ